MKIYVDIDNTICETIDTDYSRAVPIKKNIKKINNLFENQRLFQALSYTLCPLFLYQD